MVQAEDKRYTGEPNEMKRLCWSLTVVIRVTAVFGPAVSTKQPCLGTPLLPAAGEGSRKGDVKSSLGLSLPAHRGRLGIQS